MNHPYATRSPAGASQHALAFALCLLGALLLNWPHIWSARADINFDIFIHYNWVREYVDNVAAGALYPRWTFTASFGLGEPAFVFYSPLYYMATAWLALATALPAWQAMQVIEVAGNALFAWFVYLTLRSYASWRAALLIAMVALFSPFLAMLHYKFHGFAWASLGYASHGLLLWALFRPGADRRLVNVAAALAIGLAVCSHTISALVNLVCFSAVAFARPLGDPRGYWAALPRALLGWALTAALGLALSAVYLLPALGSMQHINTTAWTGSHILQAFAWPTFSMRRHGVQWFSFQWPIALPALLLIGGALAYAFANRKQQPLDAPVPAALAMGGVALFFGSELSYPLWTFEWPLLRIQLPYRFVSVIYLVGTIAAGLLFLRAQARRQRVWALLLGASLALTLLTGIGVAFKASYGDGAPLSAEIRSGDYSFRPLERRFLQDGFDGSCASGDTACRAISLAGGGYRGVPEYASRWRGPEWREYARGGLAAECQRLQASCELTAQYGDGRQWRIQAPATVALRLPVFHFPGWVVEVDGVRIEHGIDARTGLIEVPLRGGEHRVELRWVATPVERLGQGLSAAAAAVLLGLWAFGRYRRTRAAPA